MRALNLAWLVSFGLLLLGCGPSTKVQPTIDDVGRGGGGQKSQPCQGDYSPISLYLPNQLRMEDPDSIAAGTYESRSVEYFVKEEFMVGGTQQAHFTEVMLGDSLLMRPVCGAGPNSSTSTEYVLPALQSLVVNADNSRARVDASYLIQVQQGRFTAGKVRGTRTDVAGISGLLARFTEAVLYQIGPTSFELRGYVREQRARSVVMKWLVQRFASVPTPALN